MNDEEVRPLTLSGANSMLLADDIPMPSGSIVEPVTQLDNDDLVATVKESTRHHSVSAVVEIQQPDDNFETQMIHWMLSKRRQATLHDSTGDSAD